MRLRHIVSLGVLIALPGLAGGQACAVPPPAQGPGGADTDHVNASNVYQKIKDADDNGLSVGRQVAGRPAPDAAIVLDEQGEATGGRGNDAAPSPLFARVAENKLATGTYPEFISLLDNFVVQSGQPESHTDEEKAEIDRFLDEAMASRPMKLAFAYINEDLGEGLTEAQFRAAVERIWFDIYQNNFGGRPTPFCTGFEHVFVGEGDYRSGGNAPRLGEISGYHSWVKFFLDEKAGRVNYLGHKYDIPAANRPANPIVITLRMTQSHQDGASGGRVELFKPKGGFFVGLSPECELALGTVAFFESVEGLFRDEKRRVVMDGATYDLVLYQSVDANGRRGNHIRSFYPVLIGTARPVDDVVLSSGGGPVVIARALPNPEGDDETGEWVELKNITEEEVDLGSWEMRDRQGGRRKLEGTIAAGATRRFEIPRDSHEMRLGNSGGQVRLLRNSEVIDEVEYRQAASGLVIEFGR